MLIIKYKPKKNAIVEGILNLSIEINGIGIVSAKYNVTSELLTKKRVLNFSIIYLKGSVYSGNLTLFMFNFAPIL